MFMSGESERPKLAEIVWEGDSKEVLRSFPEAVIQNFGFELWQLQQGERPRNYRPLPSIGPGVFELRDQDERGWYRVVYLSRIDDVIDVLHCFREEEPRNAREGFSEIETAAQGCESAIGAGEKT
jgi:phage-related protein